jgi:hypothetical protein
VCVALVASTAGLAACGGTSSDTVAQIGTIKISKPQLSHWMSTIIGGDFYELTHVTAPTMLVSDPPHIATCMSQLKTVANGPSRSHLMSRCQQLYKLIREQALSYLINSYVNLAEDTEVGVTVDNSEIQAAFASLRSSEFPTETALHEYLAQRRWSLSDELFLVKRDLLGTKLLESVHKKLGAKASEAQIDAYYKALAAKWLAKTSCIRGYVVEGCKQYVAPASPSAVSPASVIEEVLSGK